MGQGKAVTRIIESASYTNITNLNPRKAPGPQKIMKVNMIEGDQSSKGKYWKNELSGFCMARYQTHTHTMSFCNPRLPSQHRTVPTSITEIPMHWHPRHHMPSPFLPAGYLFHKARGSAPPPCDCSLLPAGDPTLDQIACHFEHQYVRDFKCLTKLNEWHGTHHPKSHVHVPAIRAWHYSCDKIHRNRYSTPARYTAIGARARAVRSPCGHNG